MATALLQSNWVDPSISDGTAALTAGLSRSLLITFLQLETVIRPRTNQEVDIAVTKVRTLD